MKKSRQISDVVHRVLERTFDTLALANAVKCPKYGVPTANASNADNKTTTAEAFQQADWVRERVKAALTASEYAWVICTYGARDEARQAMIAALAADLTAVSRNQSLVTGLVEREFELGETWCKPVERVADMAGVSWITGQRAVKRVREALARIEYSVAVILQSQFMQAGYFKR